MAVAKDLPATFEGEVVRGTLYLRTNLDAPTYRLYAVNPEGAGALWRGGSWSRLAPTRCSRCADHRR